MFRRIFAAAAVFLLLALPAYSADITVFAAASTTNALTEVNNLYTARTGTRILTSFASSGTLAKQVDSGAPADVYLSANVRWMDHLEANGRLEPGTRQNLLGNTLVLAAAKGNTIDVDVTPGLDLAPFLDDGRLAIGDPSHVPAGQYARAALENLGMWGAVEDRLASFMDVRAALAHVALGEAPLGVVYATDAAAVDTVRVVDVFPASSHPPIDYPVAVVKGRLRPDVVAYLAFLESTEAAAVFARHGFRPGENR